MQITFRFLFFIGIIIFAFGFFVPQPYFAGPSETVWHTVSITCMTLGFVCMFIAHVIYMDELPEWESSDGTTQDSFQFKAIATVVAVGGAAVAVWLLDEWLHCTSSSSYTACKDLYTGALFGIMTLDFFCGAEVIME